MRNPYFANAVERAYANLIPEKTYPAFFICLNVPPENIDVNIHPTKTEIRFLDERVIYSILHATVKKSIGQYNLANELDFSKKTIEFPVITSSTPMPRAPQINFNPNFNPFDTKGEDLVLQTQKPIVQPLLFEKQEITPQPIVPSAKTETTPSPQQETSVAEESTPTERAFMQLADRYVAVRSKDSLLLIDQSRASERIIYERVLTNQNLQIYSQRLLTAQKHIFPPAVSFQLVEFLPVLRLYGIEMEYDKTDGGFLLLAKPLNQTPQECFELAQEIIETNNAPLSSEQKEEKRAIAISQRLKINYGEKLSQNQMQTLISQLFCLADCTHTPKGQKIIVKIGLEDLEKLFE